MTVQTLTPPQDITWTRMAFARDMIDTNFGDQLFRLAIPRIVNTEIGAS